MAAISTNTAGERVIQFAAIDNPKKRKTIWRGQSHVIRSREK